MPFFPVHFSIIVFPFNFYHWFTVLYSVYYVLQNRTIKFLCLLHQDFWFTFFNLQKGKYHAFIANTCYYSFNVVEFSSLITTFLKISVRLFESIPQPALPLPQIRPSYHYLLSQIHCICCGTMSRDCRHFGLFSINN